MTNDPKYPLQTRNTLPPDQLFLARNYPKADWDKHLALASLAKTWLAIHGSFRQKMTRIDAAVTSVLEGRAQAQEILPRFRADIQALLSHLDQHHHIEDHHYFPQFQYIEPRLIRGFEIMDEDHHVISEGIFSLSATSREFIRHATAQDSSASDRDRSIHLLQETVAAFKTNMFRHLDDEEDLVIPLVIDRHLR